MNHSFCADLSLEQDDPLAGSAAHLERNLLISWPRAKWLRTMRHASDMSDTLKQTLDSIAGNGRRINLIHRQQQDATQHQIFLMPEKRCFSVPREQLVVFLTAWQNDSPLDRWEQSLLEHDLVLCCTHGKKDKCCAKYGYQTYKALTKTVAEHQLPFDVWESSHLGGCRLAASLILLPHVRKYGRITPAQVLPFLHSEARNERYLPCYRGDSQLTPAQQCSQLAALNHLSNSGYQPQLTLIEDKGNEQERLIRWQWQLGQTHGQLNVRCHATTIMRVDSCSDLEQGPTESVVWRVREIST
ncbi:sucrase ferredoxin [Vreelandella olivaria]|uniref:sucrase ferredoxin n=1 Tax=Vreelandella olivaria TaxID=390919 RepID=UPI00201F2F55|nr:sucrase ferredoxin [Halomonas olivaria]